MPPECYTHSSSIASHRGFTALQQVVTIANGKWPGKYEIDSTGQIITGEPLQFTPENVQDYDF